MRRFALMLGSLIVLAGVVTAQHVYWQPAAPRQGDVLTIYYDTRPPGNFEPSISSLWLHWGIYDPQTGNWSRPPQAIWPAGSRLHSDGIAVQSPMTRRADSVYYVAIDFDTATQDIQFVFTDGANQWDNNSGRNWGVHFVPSGTVSWWVPEDPEPGDSVTIYYDVVAGTLPNNATSVILHWGVNETTHGAWQLPPQEIWPPGTVPQGVAAQTPMINTGGGIFRLTIHTTDAIRSIHYVTTDGSNWDNNNNRNWDIFLTEPPPVVFTHRIFRYDPRSAFATYVQGPITSVHLAGTFNGWNTQANPLTGIDPFGNRWAEVEMTAGPQEYKFVLNGNIWVNDPDNPVTVGGYNNSFLQLVPDSLPQVYNILPNENGVYNVGDNVSPVVRLRRGDLGPGLSGNPIAHVNGAPWPSSWNPAQSLLTINALPNTAGRVDVTISAVDSAGRLGRRNLAYGFRSSGYMAVDISGDAWYPVPGISGIWDLHSFALRERATGDSLEISTNLQAFGDATFALILITISSAMDGWAAIPGLRAELRVPDLSNGGISLLLLDPLCPHYQAGVHNRLHPRGDLSIAGAPVTFEISGNPPTYRAVAATADLETILGSYQTAWYYTCSSLIPASAQAGYCTEITPELGGIEGEQEPDVIDGMFFFAADVEKVLSRNYGLTRRVTFDAPGRGVAAVTPQQIGPNMAAAGPVCRILTRGAPTIDTTRTVSGRVTSSIGLSQVWLMQNSTRLNVTLQGDSFRVPVTLREGPNLFTLYAVNVNGDSGRSPAMTYTLLIDHAPDVRISTRLEGNQGVLDASATTDPDGQSVTFVWSADPRNPAPVNLQNPNSAVARFDRPQIAGEYYFNVIASDPDQHATRGRTLFTISADSADGFANDETVAWVRNAIIYEIYPRSYSPQGNLAGITADLDRIAALGVNAIWLMPIFEGPSDHGYEITDYYTIEQDYGTADDFRELVQQAHARGIKILLDMVINHTGIGHPFMQDALRHGRHSHYWDYYDRDTNGNYTYYYDWSSLPNLNYNNPDVVKYFIDVSKYWIEEFDVDGYRCDVAWGPMQRTPNFWNRWRQALKEIKPECLLLAEANSDDWNNFINRFDQCFDWQLHHEESGSFSNWFPAIPDFTNLTSLITNYGVGWPPYKDPLRFLENHDEPRFISQNTGAQTKLAASFMMSIPGTVMLYAGQEIGTRSQRGMINWFSDPDGMYPHYWNITHARQLLPALRTGQFVRNTTNAGSSCYAFSRYGPGLLPAVWAGNFTANSLTVDVVLDRSRLGIHPDSTYVVSELIGNTHFTATGAELTVIRPTLAAYQSALWVIADTAISVADAYGRRTAVPQRTALLPAYPNPFNPSTNIPLELSAAMHVRLTIYDLLGRQVATVVDEVLNAGRHEFIWNSEESGAKPGSGLYFAVMETDHVRQIQKLVMLK